MNTESSNFDVISPLLVVGDRWHANAEAGIIKISQIVQKIIDGYYIKSGIPPLRLGFGVTSGEIKTLRRVLKNNGFESEFLDIADPDLGVSKFTHKRDTKNILIKNLRTSGKQNYVANLQINKNNELILDHTTGHHVPAMVIMEAARQMFIAIVEQYDSCQKKNGVRFIVNEWSASFKRFLLPMEAVLECSINEKDRARTDRKTFQAAVLVKQDNRDVAHVEINFSTFDSELLEKKETEIVKKILKDFTPQWAEQIPHSPQTKEK